AKAGDDAVARDLPVFHPEAVRAVRGENVELDERALVEQHLDPVPGRRFAGGTPLVGGFGFGVKGLVPALAVLVDLLLGDRCRLALRGLDPLQARGGSPHGGERPGFARGHAAYIVGSVPKAPAEGPTTSEASP